MIIGWQWDTAANGTALRGVIMIEDRHVARSEIELEMHRTGTVSVLAEEVRFDAESDLYEPTGEGMIARLADPVAKTFAWRDVHRAL